MKTAVLRLCALALVAAVLLSLGACAYQISVNYGHSEYYTEKEMDKAVDLILDEYKKLEGLRVTAFAYGGDTACDKSWPTLKETAGAENAVECLLIYTLHDEKDGQEDVRWLWSFVREKKGDWKLLQYGPEAEEEA